jgi:hypothetical protein
VEAVVSFTALLDRIQRTMARGVDRAIEKMGETLSPELTISLDADVSARSADAPKSRGNALNL